MNNIYKGITAVAIVIAIISTAKTCNYAKQIDSYIGENILLKSANQSYKVQRTKDSTTIYTQQVLVADERTAKIHAESKLRNIQLSVKAKIGVKVKDVVAEYIKPDSSYLIRKSQTADKNAETPDSVANAYLTDCIPYGTKFATNNKWYYVAGTLDTNNVRIDSLGMSPGKISLILAGKRGKESVVLTTENPYMNVTGLSSVKVTDKRKRPLLLSRGAFLAYGLIAGAAGVTYLIRP
jgi:hypothetical protein